MLFYTMTILGLTVLLVFPYIGPYISRFLARSDFARIGLSEREIEYAVRRDLLLPSRLYEHLVREFLLKGKEHVEMLADICVDYHTLVHKLEKALPLLEVREIDYQIHNSLAHIHQTGVYTDK